MLFDIRHYEFLTDLAQKMVLEQKKKQVTYNILL